jgi:hypothetical protein
MFVSVKPSLLLTPHYYFHVVMCQFSSPSIFFFHQVQVRVLVNETESRHASASVSADGEGDDFSFHDTSEFVLESTDALPDSPDRFSTPSCGLDLNEDGWKDCFVGNQNGTTRVYLSNKQAQVVSGGQQDARKWLMPYEQVLNKDGSIVDLFGQGFGNVPVDPTTTPTYAPTTLLPATTSSSPTTVPSPSPSFTPTPLPTPLPTLPRINQPSPSPTLPVAPKTYVSPWCGDLDGDGDIDCLLGHEDGAVAMYTNQGISCERSKDDEDDDDGSWVGVGDRLGSSSKCTPVAQGGFALTFVRDPKWKGRHHPEAKKKHSRGIRTSSGFSFDDQSGFEGHEYNFFTKYKEHVVEVGSQTTRNVCLLAMYGDKYEVGSSCMATNTRLVHHVWR